MCNHWLRKGCTVLLASILVCVFFAHTTCAQKAEKTKITWYEWVSLEGGITQKVLDDLTAQFEKENPGIDVTRITDPWQAYRDKVITMWRAGQLPDVMIFNSNWMYDFVTRKIIEPLDPYFDKEEPAEAWRLKNKFYKPIRAEYQDKTYGLPLWGGPMALYYNARIFKEKGLTPPTTWEEYVKVGEKLSDPQKFSYATLLPLSRKNPSGAHLLAMAPPFTSMGGQWVENNRAAFNNETGIWMVQFLVDLEKKYEIAMPGSTTYTPKNVREKFIAERIFMTMDGPWGYPIYLDKNPDLDLVVARAPKGKTVGTATNVSYFGMIADGSHKSEVWKFIKFMMRDESLYYWYDKGNRMPLVEYIAVRPEFEKYKGFVETMQVSENYIRTGLLPSEEELYRLLVTNIQEVFTGKITAEEALNQAAAKYNQILEKVWPK